MTKETIYGIDYVFPITPTYATIDNAQYRKREQYFRHVEIPEMFGDVEYDSEGKVLFDEKQWKWITVELDRIFHGYWFINAGEPTYLTGKYYYFLNYWTLENGDRPEYRDCDRRYYLFLDYCEKSNWILGILRIKSRREGATSQASSNLCYTATTTPQAKCGIVSKTGDDAKSVFKEMVVYGFRNLPIFMKPELAAGDDPEKIMRFIKQSSRTKAKQQVAFKERPDGLNSQIDFKNTKLNSYDSKRNTRILIDECFGEGTKILCKGLIFKKIEEITNNDVVIVEGGKEVGVYSTCSGEDEMYKISQPYSKDYVVNSKHRLYLEQRCRVSSIKDDGIKIMTPVEFLELGKYRTRTTFGVRSSGLFFNKQDVPIDPYILGVWIGDGESDAPRVIVNHENDPEIYDSIIKYAEDTNHKVHVRVVKRTPCCSVISITNGNNRWRKSDFVTDLMSLNVWKNKHIPACYINNDEETRLNILAGIIDTDGNFQKKGCYDIGMSREGLVNDISFLAKSLGFSVRNTKKRKSNLNTDVYTISISGDLSRIPCRVERKKADYYKKKYAYRRNRIEVSKIGIGKYFGITLMADNDNDRRLILEDFTISMNCGKFPTDVPVKKYWGIVSKTLLKGASKVGFSELPTTVNAMKDGGRGAKVLWDESDHMNHEKTPTRLVRYFKPAYDGLAGFIDRHGMSVIDAPTREQEAYLVETTTLSRSDIKLGAKEYLRRQIDSIQDDEMRREEKRMMPFTEEQAFSEDDSSCYFSTTNIYEQLAYLKENPPPLRRVRFGWRDENTVDYADDPKGQWLLLKEPSNKNAYMMSDGGKKPASEYKYKIGVDPFASTIVVGKGSSGVIVVYEQFDTNDPENTGMPVALFIGRPKTKAMFHNEALMAAHFFGCKVTYENANDDYFEWFINKGYRNYISKTPKSVIDPNRKRRGEKVQTWGVSPKDAYSLNKQLELAQTWVDYHYHKMYFPMIFEDMLEYDHLNRTKYDISVGFMIALSAAAGDIRNVSKEKTDSKQYVQMYSVESVR